jgi:hypothetical protein
MLIRPLVQPRQGLHGVLGSRALRWPGGHPRVPLPRHTGSDQRSSGDEADESGIVASGKDSSSSDTTHHPFIPNDPGKITGLSGLRDSRMGVFAHRRTRLPTPPGSTVPAQLE